MTKLARKPRKTEPAGLSHATIRTTALALIDRHGLDDFSTRKLGRALGCEAMAIYWYYASKDALLDAVVDELITGVTRLVATHDGTWIEVLRAVAHAYRRIAQEHPRAFPLLATRRLASEETYVFMEKLFELGRDKQLDDQIVARFYRVVSSFVNGFALNELATLHGPKPSVALRRRFSRVAEVSEWLESKYLDELFEFGLELHLEALASSVKTSNTRRAPA